MTAWISVEDRLPELYELGGCAEDGQRGTDAVLIFDEDDACQLIAHMEPDGTWVNRDSGCKQDGVTHWKPLDPDPFDVVHQSHETALQTVN